MKTSDLISDVRDWLMAGGVENVVIGPIVNQAAAVVGLTPYPVDTDRLTGNVVTGVQVRIRSGQNGGVKTTLDTQDRVLERMEALTGVTLPSGIRVVVAWRQSSAPIGFDGSSRPELFDTYYLRTDRLASV